MSDDNSRVTDNESTPTSGERKSKKRNGVVFKHGSWWVFLRENDPLSKKSKIVWHGPFDDADAAEVQRDERKRQLKAGTALRKDQVTLNDYLDMWLEAHAINRPLRASTKETYEEKLRNYVRPTIGRMPIQSLRALDVRKWVTNLSTSGGRNGKPLAARTVRYVGAIVKQALNAAIDEYELIATNPAARVKLPMPVKSIAQVWTVDEMRGFALAAAKHRLTALYAVLAATGARRGEILALEWSDIDLDQATISITKAISIVKGVRTVDQTKNSKARVVPIDAQTVTGLRTHRLRQKQEKLSCSNWQESDLVFCRPDGVGLRPDFVYYQFQKLIRESGVRRIRLHDLRHTHATWLLDAGEHMYVVAERLGHTDPQTTARIYAHVTPKQRSATADVFANVRDGNG